ncbi:MAG: galactokinase [Acidimicrobiales bacterium]|jgi:galactokinase
MSEEYPGPLEPVVAFAPGRVNLIGDHTDYTGGLAMPIAVELGTEITYLAERTSVIVELSSSVEPESARVPISIPEDPFEIAMLFPEWSRYVAGVVATTRPPWGGKGNIVSDLPIAAGLSSSASLELATALALGYEGGTAALARLGQRAEHVACNVKTGILDQLAIASAREGHAMMLDCNTLEIRNVAVPGDVEIVVVHCGVSRSVASSAYAERLEQCLTAEREIGPLRSSAPWEVDVIRDPTVRRRARHVVSENARVRAFAGSLEHRDVQKAGELMNDSHRSLAMDYEVSIRELDDLVSWLQGLDGVLGARMTGAGFGGCAVALSRPGVLARRLGNRRFWIVRAGPGAHLR